MANPNEPFNFLSPENGVLLAHCSSQTATCPARNVLLAEKRVDFELENTYFLGHLDL